MATPIVLEHYRAPGDVLAMTALVRDLAVAYPGRYSVYVKSHYSPLWLNNPYVTPGKPPEKTPHYRLDYGEWISATKTEKVHFLSAFHKSFKTKTGLYVPVTAPHPDVHLSAEELANYPAPAPRYWVQLAGGKADFTTKHWSYAGHQVVADTLREAGVTVVQAGTRVRAAPKNYHPVLNGVIDMVGKTTLRELLCLIAKSDGVICTITFAMHAAAALGKPCIVTAGGREAWWWEAYHRDNPGLGDRARTLPVSHRYLHAIGLLDCAVPGGCWMSKVTKTESPDKLVCKNSTRDEFGQALPRCQTLITPQRVIESVFSYYIDGTLTLPEGVVIPNAVDAVKLTSGGKIYSLQMVEVGVAPPPPAALPAVQPLAAPPPVLATSPSGLALVSARVPRPPTPVVLPPTVADAGPVSHPQIGGKITMFSLLYGRYPDMHDRHLESIVNSTRPEAVEWRVYLNEACDETKKRVDDLVARGRISVVYKSEVNRFKYPCMREAFHDPANPINTRWTMWADDDSFFDVQPDTWFNSVCRVISSSADLDPKLGMVGVHQVHNFGQEWAAWIRQAPWYRKRPFRDASGRPAPNGSKIHFGTGSWWCMKTEVIKAADIPDSRLQNTGGDTTIGEQVWQAGYTMRNYGGDKKTILWSAVPRRGVTHKFFDVKHTPPKSYTVRG